MNYLLAPDPQLQWRLGLKETLRGAVRLLKRRTRFQLPTFVQIITQKCSCGNRSIQSIAVRRGSICHSPHSIDCQEKGKSAAPITYSNKTGWTFGCFSQGNKREKISGLTDEQLNVFFNYSILHSHFILSPSS